VDTLRWVLHVDLDQFIAAVEVLRRPELTGRPVVVGGSGDPTQRGVVATASYEARTFGVRSGIPLRTAAKRCPEAVFLAADHPAYEEASARVMDTLREFPAVVEVMGWDEAFLEVHSDDPESVAHDIQQAVRERTRLDCSVGIGDNKLRAKLATGFGKPAGVFRLTEDNWWTVMGDLRTDALWGIGAKTARKLADLGIDTVRGLAAADPHLLADRLGPTMGPWYRRLARGAAVPQPGDDLPGEPHRLGDRPLPGGSARRAGGTGRPGGRPSSGAGGDQGAVRAVRDADPQRAVAGTDRRPGRDRGRRARGPGQVLGVGADGPARR
jgi:DNA polymerase-4